MKEKIGYIYIVLAACFWGMIGIFVRDINSYGLSSMQIVALRSIGATIIMVIYSVLFKKNKLRIKIKDIWIFLGTGIGSMVFFNFCYFGSIKRTSLAVAAALLYTSPAFVAILAKVFLKEKITVQKCISIVIVILGCALTSGIVTTNTKVDVIGLILGLGSGLGYALYSLFSKIAIKKGYTDEVIVFYTFLFAAMGSGWTLVGEFTNRAYSIQFIMALIGLILISTVLAYMMYTKGLLYVSAGKAAVLASMEPVVATIIGIVMYKEVLQGDVITGIIIILISASVSAKL